MPKEGFPIPALAAHFARVLRSQSLILTVKSELLKEDLTMENFEKVIKNSQPFIERTIVPKGAKVSFSSSLIVRLQYFSRRIFRRR
jgi:hypothetical protein